MKPLAAAAQTVASKKAALCNGESTACPARLILSHIAFKPTEIAAIRTTKLPIMSPLTLIFHEMLIETLKQARIGAKIKRAARVKRLIRSLLA